MEMQEFNIGKIGGKIGNFIKKKPVLIAGGVVVLIGGIYYFMNQGTNETVYYAAGDTDSASGASEESSEVDLTELEQKLMEQIDSQYEDLRISTASDLASMFSSLVSDLSDYTEISDTAKYVERYEIAAPAVVEETQLQKQIANILNTESLKLETGYNYSAEDIEGMSNWANEEQKAISSGASGTSKNAKVSSGTKVTYNKDGTVSFGSGKSTSSGKAVGSENYSSSNKAVSSITKKSGTIESQLSGKSQSEKRSILKSAGLI